MKERAPAARDRARLTVGREQGSHTVTAVTGWSKIWDSALMVFLTDSPELPQPVHWLS